MPQVFAYIVHRGGVLDDSASELVAAALKIDSAARPIALVAGYGAELDAVCESLRSSYAEVWKIANQDLAYPNAELIRKALRESPAARKHRAGPARSFRNRPGTRTLHQAQRGICLRRGRDRSAAEHTRSTWSARSLAGRSALTCAATFLPVRSSRCVREHSSP